MSKNDLQERNTMCGSTISKLNKDQKVHPDILVGVCAALNCDTGDISEIMYGH